MTDNPIISDKVKCHAVCKGKGAFKKADDFKAVNILKKDSNTHAPATPGPAVQFDVSAGKGEENDDHSSTKPLNQPEYLPSLRPGKDGKVDWTPLSDLTGTRPKVNKYSISRYSLQEWNKHNAKVLDTEVNDRANEINYDSKTAIMTAYGNIDRSQHDNNDRLKQKSKELFKWKLQIEQACKAMADEVELMEIERQRLKGAARVLMLPVSISQECVDLRSDRAIPDLVADLAEKELLKEFQIVNDIKTTLKHTIKELEEQQTKNKAVKHKLEYDFCDKKSAYDIDCLNMSFTPKSATILFQPGATKFGEHSASLEYWEWFARESIQTCETARQESINLRSSYHNLLVDGGRRLRMQADKTDTAFAETVTIQNELCTKLKNNLHQTIDNIAATETLIGDLKDAIRNMDSAMKLAQTRLANRNTRSVGETVRDKPHLGLIDEVQKIHETVAGLRAQMQKAETVRNDLLDKRIELEREIAAKLKTLNIDRTRCGMMRSHFPSASELAGL